MTPCNIPHQLVRRNSELAWAFNDLRLIEREGCGFDLIYETLTSQEGLPIMEEGPDWDSATMLVA